MDNDGRFPNNSWVEVRYPQPVRARRMAHLRTARELGTLEDGSAPPPEAADEDLYYPACFRGASELRRATAEEDR